MPFSGIPYIFDIVSTVIEYNYGKGDKFEYILTLDILNLLSVSYNLLQTEKCSVSFFVFRL